jgi:hypothetical protein
VFYIKGGVEGRKESFDALVSRVSSFGKYHFLPPPKPNAAILQNDNQPSESNTNDGNRNIPTKYPAIEALFASREFQEAAKAICPLDNQLLDPFQFNFIMQASTNNIILYNFPTSPIMISILVY